MNQPKALLVAVSALTPLLVIACGSSTPAPSVTCTNGNIVANEANDYAFSSTIMLPSVTVKSMSNLMVDWGGVTKDFLGHPVDPVADLNTIFLLLVDLPAATFQEQLNADSFSQSDIVASPPPSINPNGVTSANLYGDFMVGGRPVTADLANPFLDATKYTPANSTFAMVAQSGTNIGSDIKMIQAFHVDDSSTNTAITFTNTSTKLTYDANLHSLHPTGVPAGTAALMLDWTQMTGKKNALGADFITTNITSAIVGHYTQTAAQLETQFLDLETLTTELYRAEIPSGTMLDFTTLMDSAGHSFPGVDATGTWLVALVCGGCRNPAPWYLTILEPAPQPCAM